MIPTPILPGVTVVKKPTILLWDLDYAGLLIPCSSGIIYQNQTGGNTCLQDSLEGVFVPLASEPMNHLEALHGFFFEGPKWAGACARGIDEDTAVFIDILLARTPAYSGIRVNRGRLKDSHEAWIWVMIADPASTGVLEGFKALEAVLTWPNSD